MRALLDEVDVDRRPDGTVVRLRHRIVAGAVLVTPSPELREEGACTVRVAHGVAVLEGELDLSTAAAVRDQLFAAAPSAIDLSGVAYLDSAGARVLLEASERLARPPAVIAPPGSGPRRALELSGLAALLDLRDA
jgi:anti-anti-sigma factor